MNRKKIICIITALILAVFFTSCGEKNKQAENEKHTGDIENTHNIENIENKIGDLIFETTTIYGDSVTESDFDGNILTVVNIWGTWCPPCVSELPHLQEVSEYYAEKNVELVGILQDGVNSKFKIDEDVVSDAKKLLDNAKVSYKILLPDNQLYNDYIKNMQYYPTTFFFDSERNLIKTVVGANSAKDWKAIIDEVLESFE